VSTLAIRFRSSSDLIVEPAQLLDRHSRKLHPTFALHQFATCCTRYV
jgi:hypothetical protein